MTDTMIAPPGLKGLVVADTHIGSVRGDEGFFHYRNYDATWVARHHTLEAATSLLLDGELPNGGTESTMRSALATQRQVDAPTLDAISVSYTHLTLPTTPYV